MMLSTQPAILVFNQPIADSSSDHQLLTLGETDNAAII
jgi:hypothetical protein